METKNNNNLFEKIMLCTDNSADAKAAELFAAKILEVYKSELYVLHLYNAPQPPDQTGIYVDEFETAYRHQQRKKLSDRFSDIHETQNVTYIAQPRYGKTADAIIDEAEKLKITLLIIGTHGASGFLGNSFGSNALGVIEQSTVPVLAVPSNAKFKGIQHISIATKWLDEELKLVKQFLPWIKQTNPKLSFIHVYESEKEPDIDAEELNRTFQIYFPGIQVVLTNIKATDVAGVLENHTIENEVDCLIMFAENKNLFERLFAPNISKQMLYQLQVPILYIPK
jgi:nucleotide-binding universal stress UspA family protein